MTQFLRSIATFVAAFFLTFFAGAQTAPTVDENSLLWEISGNDLPEPSFLFGTIHMIPAEHFDLSESAKVAFDKAQRIAFEIDTENMNNPMAALGLLDRITMQGDTSLSDLLTEDEYQQVSDHFDNLGIPLAFMHRIKPMFLTIFASEDLDMLSPASKQDIKSYELELTNRAKEQQKDILGLETVDFQLSLFDSIPYQAQAQMLLDAIRSESGEADGSFDEMVDLYLREDIVGMQALMQGENGGTMGAFEELLLLRRNRSWIPLMQELMTDGPVFFAVGAGHLAGEEGVIALLRNAGYTLKPLRS